MILEIRKLALAFPYCIEATAFAVVQPALLDCGWIRISWLAAAGDSRRPRWRRLNARADYYNHGNSCAAAEYGDQQF
jgi:hypothetical protein